MAEALPASRAALEAASNGLFYSLPVAFDPAESSGPYLATLDRDAAGEPFRFLDLGALIASQPFGENEPDMVAAVLRRLPYAVGRSAHSEYQTALSLELKAALDGVAPAGTPRHFVVNTGAEAVENAIKAVLLNRVKTRSADPAGAPREGPTPGQGLFIVSFDGAFHGRTLGSLAATQRKRARLGFPTFDWPHASFPVEDPRSPSRTRRRDEKSLEQVWTLLVTGRSPGAPRQREQFRSLLAACDELLSRLPADAAERSARVRAFVEERRRLADADSLRRAQRAAGVLVEPIQGEGGLRFASAHFFQRLRLLTRVYDVPLLFDEVQTGWGAAGRLWAHDLFDLPSPPDAVMWAKKAQNGILFVSEELATFFQEEKKFNTTWEGDSVGMVRLLAFLRKLDLERVRRTGALAREGLERLAKDYRGLLQNVRGAGCLLAFDVVRSDWREWLRDRAFRRGLILLPAGERALRFYPRYDMEPGAIGEALELLRRAVEDLVGGRASPSVAGPEIRVGTLEARPATLQAVDLAGDPEGLMPQVAAVEVERYGNLALYPPDVLRAGRRPLLQYSAETLASTMANPGACGVALRDRVSQRLVAYALGSPLENHDEVGVRDDPRYGENDTFYLQAMAVSPLLRNRAEVEAMVLDLLRERVREHGFAWISALIEARLAETGPRWMREATALETVEDYLQSGIRFAYLRAPC
ncbi:MAG TPA: aminotransferase class III-fold pyridoxal phosphate-dependent enzyme [Anaeromyxobacteraceae bacterium]|nr:aminotransferase class III-fold pyridoxal phosphate-dependent enzyme [Anaeromyxobacteraceae bacterium]